MNFDDLPRNHFGAILADPPWKFYNWSRRPYWQRGDAGKSRAVVIAPSREHSRKPDGIHGRIERLVAGPYLELFARQQRPGWTVWGNETDKFKPAVPKPEWDEMWSKPFDRPELVWGGAK